MISVIIPTMWKANNFLAQMYSNLLDNELVTEIIVVNNNVAETPPDFPTEKLVMLNSEKNLYYNASINKGVSTASNEIICLMNDDIFFSENVFERIVSSYDSKTMGMICPYWPYKNRPRNNVITIEAMTLREQDILKDGMGTCMFMSKSHFVPIPEELVHHWGDVFLWSLFRKQGLKNYFLYDWEILTPMRVTSSRVPGVRDIINADRLIMPEVFKAYDLEDPCQYII